MHHRPAKPSKCVSLKLDSAEVSDLSLAHSSDGQCNEGHDVYRQGVGQRARRVTGLPAGHSVVIEDQKNLIVFCLENHSCQSVSFHVLSLLS